MRATHSTICVSLFYWPPLIPCSFSWAFRATISFLIWSSSFFSAWLSPAEKKELDQIKNDIVLDLVELLLLRGAEPGGEEGARPDQERYRGAKGPAEGARDERR